MKSASLKPMLCMLCLLLTLQGFAQDVVKGVVTDAVNQTQIPGVAIRVRNRNMGTVSDPNGGFTLTLNAATDTIVASSIGYLTQEIAVGGRKLINISLQADPKKLGELVVIGYTTVRRKDLTGAVASMGPEQLTRMQSNNVVSSLVGLAGVRATGSDAGSIRIRGNRSVAASNTPLLIVDGMPYYGSLNTIDQNDIASLDILKDASSAALYGSRGANGIIVITTKKGIKGKSRISVDSYTGVGKYYWGNLRNMNAAEYIQFKRDANRAAGIWNSTADDSKIFSTVELDKLGQVDNNFAKDYYNKLGFQTNNTVTFTSGSDRGSQKISFNYLNNKARGKNMSKYDRFILSTDHDMQIRKNIRIGLSSRLSYEKQQNEPGSFGYRLFRFIPTVELYDENGELIAFPIGDSLLKNPFLDENRDAWDSQSSAYQAFIKGFFSVDILPGLNFRTNLSMDQVFTDAGSYIDNRSAVFAEALNQASISNGKSSRYAWNNILNYKKTFGDHSIDAFGVFELQESRSLSSNASGSDQALAQYKWYNIDALTQNKALGSEFVRSQQLSYVGRVQYGYKDRYILTGTMRYDGASQLAPRNRWDLFPSIAAAWNISEEPFFKVKPVSNLKLRASYGLTGNNAISPYATYGAVLTRYTIFGGSGGDIPYPTLEPDQLGVETLKWEKTKMLNAGVDFGLFEDRITGSVDFYSSKTSDLLNRRKLPYTTGFNNVWANIGKSQNTGIEITLNAVAIDKKDLRWSLGLNFYHNKEELTELYDPRLTKDIQNGWWVGYPVNGVTFDYVSAGIWQTNEAHIAAIYGRKPGEIKIKDLDGDGAITGNDRQIIGTERPTLGSSLTTTLTYKNFDLMLDVYSEIGALTRDDWSTTRWANDMGRFNAAKIDYWTPENPSNKYPQPLAGRSSLDFISSIGYYKNDFVRLRNATLGYTFTKLLPFAERARVYVAAAEPLRYWRYTAEGGLADREVVYNIGFNLTF